MKKNVILCDRCGKEIIDPTVKYNIFRRMFKWLGREGDLSIERVAYQYYTTKTNTFDLCDGCDKLFIEWIKSGNDAKSAE